VPLCGTERLAGGSGRAGGALGMGQPVQMKPAARQPAGVAARAEQLAGASAAGLDGLREPGPDVAGDRNHPPVHPPRHALWREILAAPNGRQTGPGIHAAAHRSAEEKQR
jgi:hypothetical protein